MLPVTQTRPAVFRNISEVVPPGIELKLIELGEVISRNEWAIGSITNMLLDHIEKNVFQIDRMRLYSWIGVRVGRTQRTVRWYALVTRGAPYLPNLYPTLRFAHFAAARRIAPDNYLPILDAAQEESDRRGAIAPSVEWIEARFARNDQDAINAELELASEQGMIEQERPVLTNHPMQGKLSWALTVIDTMAGIAASLPVNQKTRKRIMDALRNLQDALSAANSELDSENG